MRKEILRNIQRNVKHNGSCLKVPSETDVPQIELKWQRRIPGKERPQNYVVR